jgi:putative two-component system response regulator
MHSAAFPEARILVVDDEPANVSVLERLLAKAGYTDVVSLTDSSQVLPTCLRSELDMILLDLHMPAPDGFAVMASLRPWLESHSVPILVLTADVTDESKKRALSEGAKDFVTKPFDAVEVVLRIENLLETRFFQTQLRNHNLLLDRRVRERTVELNEARLEVIRRLAIAGEYRDDDTGQHALRVGRTSASLALAAGLRDDDAELIRHAAPLHDIGKIGVPDRILLKPGPLTQVEMELMKNHVHIGAMILSGSRSPLLQVAEQIASTHHEWWDGGGYPHGLRGHDIPLAGRVVAIADVFDALTHDRPYKPARSLEESLAEIQALSGTQLDPELVAAFHTLDHRALLSRLEDAAGAPGQSDLDTARLASVAADVELATRR